ncbi:MAG: hypothetical protein RSG51_04070 [Bacilli bacterium]
MKLNDIKTLSQISEEYNISINTLKTRLSLKSLNLIEGVDFRKLGRGQATLLTPEGVAKITSKSDGVNKNCL